MCFPYKVVTSLGFLYTASRPGMIIGGYFVWFAYTRVLSYMSDEDTCDGDGVIGLLVE